ncbi:transposase [Ligilactobacillus ruminis]|nr:transposase [Ligilactobacillus ruminis]UWP41209.1 transposase [Ligilactobacillus ruminis]
MKSVVVDLNAQYIKALFPNARIIIDRFHIILLVLTASSMISPTVRLKE